MRARLKLAGKLSHEELFFKDNGDPIRSLQYPWVRWKRSLNITLKGRCREPYNARHSSVSWNLMVGKNPLWVAKQHGHSVHVMLDVYAAWTEGAKDPDITAIKQAMQSRPNLESARTPTTTLTPLQPPEFGTALALAPLRRGLRSLAKFGFSVLTNVPEPCIRSNASCDIRPVFPTQGSDCVIFPFCADLSHPRVCRVSVVIL